jgi:aminopeptidase
MQDISLELANGQVIAARAKQGQELLERILSIDAGARRLGEVALGCNFRVTQLTGHPLVDEKMGGAFHLALGASLPGTGGCNISAVHWDLVLDLRRGGRVDVDGERCIEDGRFLPAW